MRLLITMFDFLTETYEMPQKTHKSEIYKNEALLT